MRHSSDKVIKGGGGSETVVVLGVSVDLTEKNQNLACTAPPRVWLMMHNPA